ncbi:putative cytochrome p450 6a1 [Rosellinia necatrix]|uniref:Putative cytochrome p450 6a1 n=1 Tax=Rosellinia necatrix TaxID=77044 RepID=A0A1W2TWS1_ROSNE|nr:putative cytochrome p450 6a1 [Rosellinia necatrix]
MDAALSVALRPREWSATAWVLLLTTAASIFYRVFWRPALPKNAPKWYKKGDWPIVGALEFYYGRRADFTREALQASKTGNFSFYIGKKQMIGISGAEGRKLFFESKDLNFPQAFAELLTGQPAAPSQGHEDNFSQVFQKALIPLMKKENFIKNLDLLTGDTRAACDALAAAPPSRADPDWQVTDPFESFYEIVYQLTMRTVGANDIAEDPKLLKHTLSIFDWFEKSDSFAKVIFPWLPTLNHFMRLYYGAKLAFVFRDIIDKRNKTGKKGNDALQFLMDRGLTLQNIVGFEIGALFAGQLNSGINAGYLQIFLTQNPEWMARLREEVDGVVARHRRGPSQTRADVLGALTIEEWEGEFPLIDLALRETIRFCLPGATFRKNMSGRDIPIGGSGEVIPDGAYAIYLIEDSMFGDWYTDKMRWNPSRYFEENAEDKKTPHAYMGWGSGRHPCLGMKFAKLEMALITAYWVGLFDFELSDKDGNRVVPDSSLMMNRNLHSAKKPETNMYLRYRLRED